MKRKTKIFTFLTAVLLTGLAVVTASSNLSFFNVSTTTKAEKPSNTAASANSQIANIFELINDKGQEYKANPSEAKANELANLLMDSLLVVTVPGKDKASVVSQVASGHLNGSSDISEANVVSTLNNMASAANAPSYAYASSEQVSVVRRYLNRLIPDVVSASGGMDDMEAFAVFVGTLSQKLDNEDFMVSQSQFAANQSNLTGDEIPGLDTELGDVEVVEDAPQVDEMIQAINNYSSSKDQIAPTNLVSMLGIQ